MDEPGDELALRDLACQRLRLALPVYLTIPEVRNVLAPTQTDGYAVKQMPDVTRLTEAMKAIQLAGVS